MTSQALACLRNMDLIRTLFDPYYTGNPHHTGNILITSVAGGIAIGNFGARETGVLVVAPTSKSNFHWQHIGEELLESTAFIFGNTV